MTKLAGLLVGISLLASAPAYAVTFNFTNDHCENTCGGAQPYGSITLTDTAAGVDVSISALSGNTFNWNGGGLNVFNWNGTAGLTNLSITGLTTGYSFVTPVGNQDGFGSFLYGISHPNGTGDTGPLNFTILGWNFSDFKQSIGGDPSVFFTLDVFGTNNKTGLIGTTNLSINPTVSEVPVPGAVWLFGSALGGLVMLSRRRKRKLQQLEQSVA